MSNVIKFLDIQFDLEAINQALVARRSGYTKSYVSYLLSGARDGEEAQKTVRDTIILIYGEAIKRVPSMGKNTNKKNKSLLKKVI